MLLLLSFLIASHAQADSPSIFYQSEAQILRDGNFACTETSLGPKIQKLQSLCGQPVSEWKKTSLALISLPNEARSSREAKLSAVVLRNTFITETYAQLYLMSRESFPACAKSLLPWVGGASLGSLKSGQVMRSGLSSHVGGIAAFDQVTDGNYQPRFRKLFGPLANFALESATLALGEGNLAIFTDLYWQLLAGATCGPEEVVRTIERTPGWKKDNKLKLSHRSWVMLSKAAQTCDPAQIILANQGFVEVEQYLVGQQAMYEGLLRSLGGWALSPLVEPAVPQALGSFPNFLEHAQSRNSHWRVSFANVNQRVSWMKEQLEVMENEFQRKNWLLAPLFCSAVADSEQTRQILD